MERTIETPLGNIILRPQKLEDVPFIEAYLFDSDPEFLESIGFKLSALGNRNDFRSKIENRIKNTAAGEIPVQIIAEFEGRAISHTWLEIGEGVQNAHFHIYEENLRGKGLGVLILKNAVEMLMDAHNVDEVYIEPKATNERMIRLLKKCGFKNLGSSVYKNPQVGELEAIRFEVTT